MIDIRQPLCFSEIGRKENQEDALFPKRAGIHTRVFILCDGMGGHERGEVASETVSSALGSFLTLRDYIDIPVFNEGLKRAFNALDRIEFSSDRKPGTTMAALCLNDDSYLVAHIGDSRIYHIRPSLYDAKEQRGGVIYQSSDHSLVNDLLKAGELTEEEARVFPHKNIITRAMQPLEERRARADVYLFDDIESGDYFFICCDGILEQLSNDTLCGILASPGLSDVQKMDRIRAVCDGKTRDNYTCWLVPVDKVSISRKDHISSVIAAEADSEDKLSVEKVPEQSQEPRKGLLAKLFGKGKR